MADTETKNTLSLNEPELSSTETHWCNIMCSSWTITLNIIPVPVYMLHFSDICTLMWWNVKNLIFTPLCLKYNCWKIIFQVHWYVCGCLPFWDVSECFNYIRSISTVWKTYRSSFIWMKPLWWHIMFTCEQKYFQLDIVLLCDNPSWIKLYCINSSYLFW